MSTKYSLKQVKEAKGDLQSFANRLFLEPVFDRTTWFIVNFTNLTANKLSVIGFLFGIGAAFSFYFQYFITGAIFFELMNLFDTFDGRVARLKKQHSKFGMYVDSYLGFWITFFMAFGLISGLYSHYGDIRIWIYGFILYFLLIIHFLEGNVAGFIMGGQKKYMKSVTKKKTKSMLTKFRSLLVKKGLREPFNMTDNQHIIFFIMPVTGLFYGLYWFMVVGILLNSAVWYLNYKNLLLK